MAASLAAFPCTLLFKRSLSSFIPFRALTSSISSSSLEFNITFAPKPKSKPDPDSLSGQQLFIPWIVRGDDGKLKLQSHPPARLLHEMANADSKTKTKKSKDPKQKPRELTAPPKHSKAARRFYNENFRESQRLSKVLAAAGGTLTSFVTSIVVCKIALL